MFTRLNCNYDMRPLAKRAFSVSNRAMTSSANTLYNNAHTHTHNTLCTESPRNLSKLLLYYLRDSPEHNTTYTECPTAERTIAQPRCTVTTS